MTILTVAVVPVVAGLVWPAVGLVLLAAGVVLKAVCVVLQAAVLMVLAVCQMPLEVGLVLRSVGPAMAHLLLCASCMGGAPAVMSFAHGGLISCSWKREWRSMLLCQKSSEMKT